MIIKRRYLGQSVTLQSAAELSGNLAGVAKGRLEEGMAVKDYIHKLNGGYSCGIRDLECDHPSTCCLVKVLNAIRTRAKLESTDPQCVARMAEAEYCLTKCPKPCAGLQKFKELIEES